MAIKISGTSVIDDNRKALNMRFTTELTTADTTATAGSVYVVTSAGVDLTLPSTPTVGDQIKVIEAAGDTTSRILRGGENIQGAANNIIIDSAYTTVDLIYVDASTGWVLGL